MSLYDTDELNEKRICHSCITEPYLKEEVKISGRRVKCSYCGDVAKCYLLDQLSDRVETAFNQFYIRTSQDPDGFEAAMLADKESNYEWEREGSKIEYAIMDAAGIPEQAAIDVQQILEDKNYSKSDAECGMESDFASDSYYDEKAPNDEYWQSEWNKFENSLKTKARFFNAKAERHLRLVFKGIGEMQTHDGKAIIIKAGPKEAINEIYRARVFQSDEKLKEALFYPDIQLGAPPGNLARPGRMNSNGISVFYGSNKPQVAMAEVRPPVGSKVAIARFEIIKALKLLDLTALESVNIKGSIFDPNFAVQSERSAFLRNLSKRLIVPVMPDDENFDYLPTQAIADYLAMASKPKLDGIIFRSVQVNGEGINVILFHHASKVKNIESPESSTFSLNFPSFSDEYYDPDYSVTIVKLKGIKKISARLKPDRPFDFKLIDESVTEYDRTKPSLKIDLESVRVNLVQSVQFKTLESDVKRYKFDKNELDDN